MQNSSHPVVIIGAGIGGLTAAIGLTRAGIPVKVFERAPHITQVGAGLTIQPNATLALRMLGLGQEAERAGAILRVGALLRSDGRVISQLPREEGEAMLQEVGAPIVGIHRATLHELLLRELPPGVLELGRACAGYRVDGELTYARFHDGEERACRALIGADGLRSAIRAQLVGDGEPVYAGYTSWRGVTSDRCGLPVDFGGEMWGRGERFGGCAIDGERFYWFAVANAPEGEREANAAETKQKLLERFASWGNQVPALIRSTPESAILRTDISDRPPLASWGKGCVTLLGDAAHAMTPNLGQGACQAIEDALVLTHQLAQASDAKSALRAYEMARRERANAVVSTARRVGAIGQWQNPLACALRDALFASLPTRLMKKQMLDGWKLPYAAPQSGASTTQ